MANNEWAEGSDLAGMSRSGNVLQQLGYDPDEVRMKPTLRDELMAKLAGPYAAERTAAPVQVAQNTPPPALASPNPRSQNGNDISAPSGQPRLFNRVQPTVPQQPVPSTLGSATVDASTTTPATSASVSSTGTSSAAPSNTVDITNARSAADKLLAPEPDIPDTTREDTMISAKSIPLNQRDPMYKEGTAGKVGRGFKGFAVGLARGGVPAALGGAVDPALVGQKAYGAPNSDYDIDDETRKAQLGLAQKQKLDALARFKMQADLRKQQDTASHDAGEIANATAKLPNEATTASADMLRAQSGTPDAKQKESENQFKENQSRADKMGLKGSQRTLYLANGKLPDPRQATAEDIGRAQATAAWHRDNPGKQPGLDDIRSINAAVSGSEIKGGKNGKPISPALQNKILDEKKAAMDLATAQYRDGMDKSGQTFKQSDYVAAMQAAQDKFEAAIEAEGGTTDHMTVNADGSWTAAKGAALATSTLPPPPPGGTPKLGADGAWPGSPKQANETAVISPSGEPTYVLTSKLGSVLSRGYKKAN